MSMDCRSTSVGVVEEIEGEEMAMEGWEAGCRRGREKGDFD
jgi:hypothetical protein